MLLSYTEPSVWRATPFRLYAAAYLYILSYLPYQEGVFSVQNVTMRHALKERHWCMKLVRMLSAVVRCLFYDVVSISYYA